MIAADQVPRLLHESFPGVTLADATPAQACEELAAALVAAAHVDVQPQDDPFLARAFALIEQMASEGDHPARDLVQEAICETLEDAFHREAGRLAACLELMGPHTRAMMEQLLRGPA